MNSPDESILNIPLVIGYDGKRAANNKTGLGNYSRSLIGHLAERYTENSYLVYTPQANPELLNIPVFSRSNVKLKFPDHRSLFWRSFGMVKQLLKDKVMLFHGLSHEIPFSLHKTNIKSIVTIHDLIFLVYPRYYRFFDRLIYTFKSRYACRRADRILAISEQTKKDIIRFYDIAPEKIDVLYQSCDEQFKAPASAEEKVRIRQKYDLNSPYVLSVGTIESRKNLLLVIRALSSLKSDLKLVVIGKETAYAHEVKREIEERQLQDKVVFLKNVPFTDLPAIYQLATTFVYPSRYEGFGIPVIEALYSGIPVIAATGSCLEEAGGPDSIYVSPDDPRAMATAIDNVQNDATLRSTMISKGRQYVQQFDQEKVSHKLMNCYFKTLGL